MTEHESRRGHRRADHPLLLDLEHAIRVANREIIHKRLPEVSSKAVLQLAVSVARQRAAYLEAALALAASETQPKPAEIAHLAELRAAYDEMRAAFDALRRALDRGYVETADGGGETA